ncbi:ABC transporter ATP-binding protein [Bacillus sp. 31A1R]|uniref:ABC transporter ATP-binding protein n=1 Tax=Robertmurraya mangrovi TaxID=3098077 RepID=A0ABU5IXR6_9BACI|nr:ABC transporter ATP-binding protein [Bacillus sp. 31A1R]MDZ5471939.1 ABC transporter ATP-binding protein [Bacillus sp. 31A1R]
MIIIEGLNKFYGKKQSLKDVSLKINAGDIYGLLGPNGAGKSTLLSILALTSSPGSGNVEMDGIPIKKRKQISELIGYVPQDLALWENLSVKENFKFWNNFSKTRLTDEQLHELCQKVKLEDKWMVKVSHLSGGMKRKLNIAVALIHNPKILLMDEPTVGIDLQSKLEINHYLRELAATGKTIVYITHDITEILTLCDRVGILKEGSLQFSGTIKEAQQMLREKGNILKNDEETIYKLLTN